MNWLHSTGNYTQYFVITYKKKGSEIHCLYITESLCCNLKLTQYCKSTILHFKKKDNRPSTSVNPYTFAYTKSAQLSSSCWQRGPYIYSCCISSSVIQLNHPNFSRSFTILFLCYTGYLLPRWSYRNLVSVDKKMLAKGVPCGLVVRIWCFHCCCWGSIPGLGTEILQATCCSKKKKKVG